MRRRCRRCIPTTPTGSTPLARSNAGGRQSSYLTGLFADDNFNRGQPEGLPETSFRVLTAEVVLVSAHLRIKGQGVVGGGTLDRDNFSLRALQRQVDGSWLIVSEMFQDANTETTYAH